MGQAEEADLQTFAEEADLSSGWEVRTWRASRHARPAASAPNGRHRTARRFADCRGRHSMGGQPVGSDDTRRAQDLVLELKVSRSTIRKWSGARHLRDSRQRTRIAGSPGADRCGGCRRSLSGDEVAEIEGIVPGGDAATCLSSLVVPKRLVAGVAVRSPETLAVFAEQGAVRRELVRRHRSFLGAPRRGHNLAPRVVRRAWLRRRQWCACRAPPRSATTSGGAGFVHPTHRLVGTCSTTCVRSVSRSGHTSQ